MSFGYFLFERFSEISTIALHIFFLHRIMDTKLNFNKPIAAAVLFASARMIYYLLGMPYRPYFALFSGIVYASLVFVGNMKAYAVWVSLLVVLDGIVDAVIISVYLLFPNTTAEQIDEFGLVRVISILAAKGVSFVLYRLMTRRVDKEHTMRWCDFGPLLVVRL